MTAATAHPAVDAGRRRPRVLHLAVAYALHEGMARTATDFALRLDGLEHGLCTSRFRTPAPAFAFATAIGGRPTSFPLGNSRAVARAVAEYGPDLLHLHGGLLMLFFARHAFGVPAVASLYGSGRLPSRRDLARAGLADLVDLARSQRALVATALIGDGALRPWLSGDGPLRAVIAHDRQLADRLARLSAVPVHAAALGTTVDGPVAAYSDEPVIAYAGRADASRGVATLLAAMPAVIRSRPRARLRLLLLPGTGLRDLEQAARRSPVADAVDLVPGPAADLRRELARCTVATFPFRFDHTIAPSPPLTVVESMSVGLPVVVSAVRCMEPVVQARAGVVTVPPDDPAALARGLLSALEPGRWHDLAASARAAARRRWSSAALAGTVRTAYQEALGRADL